MRPKACRERTRAVKIPRPANACPPVSIHAAESSRARKHEPGTLKHKTAACALLRGMTRELRENALFFQVFQQHDRGLLRRGVCGVDRQLRLERFFIGIVDSGETLQLTGAGLLVKP